MLLETIEEFCVLARVRSYTKAARELHVSQPTLSRHIKALEAEMGFELVGSHNNHLYLTQEGQHFLNSVIPLIDGLKTLIEECRSMHDSPLVELTIQEPPFQDIASVQFLKKIAQFKKTSPGIQVSYKSVWTSPQTSLAENIVDVVLEYRYGSTEQIRSYNRSNDFKGVGICDVQLFVGCQKDTELAKHSSLRIEDLDGVPIMAMYNDFSPCRFAIAEMFTMHDIRPNFVNCPVSSVFEFFMNPLPAGGVYILPEGAADNFRPDLSEDLVFVPLEDGWVHYIAVMNSNYRSNPALASFVDFFEELYTPDEEDAQ